MITIKRIHDMELVRKIITDSSVWDKVSDDSCKKEDFFPVDAPNWFWLLVEGDMEILGVFFLHPHNFVCYEIHTALLPKAYGEKAKLAGKKVLKWIFENTQCQKVITNVPEINILAKKFAETSGLSLIGINTKSFIKNGKIMDQYILGIEKGEFSCL